MTKDSLGNQTMLELYGCDAEKLNDQEFISKVMLKAAEEANATVVQQFFHAFSPHGLSGTVVIMESHINIHTWPEHEYAAVDIFTCGEDMNEQAACDYLFKELDAKQLSIDTQSRGSLTTVQQLREKQTRRHH